jgi:hypothetical protein
LTIRGSGDKVPRFRLRSAGIVVDFPAALFADAGKMLAQDAECRGLRNRLLPVCLPVKTVLVDSFVASLFCLANYAHDQPVDSETPKDAEYQIKDPRS